VADMRKTTHRSIGSTASYPALIQQALKLDAIRQAQSHAMHSNALVAPEV